MLRATLILITFFACLIATNIVPTQTAAQTSGLIRWGYYVPNDPTSLASLSKRSGDLDYVGLHWASMRADATVDIKAQPEVISLVRSIGAKPILSVTVGSADIAHTLFASESASAAAVDSLVAACSNYDGISIDFEGLDPADRDGFTRFMSILAARLRPSGKLVSIAISAKTSDTRTGWAGAHDYAGLAPHADLFVLMAYGFRTSRSSVPGSVAPFSWVEATLKYTVSQIPPSKVLLGIPLYGYDWDTDNLPPSGPAAKVLCYPDAQALAAKHGSTIAVDPVQQSAHFSYTDSNGHKHDAWLENRDSLLPKLELVNRYNIAGVAGWRLGHEDPEVWQSINSLRPIAIPSPTPTIAPSPTPTTAPTTNNRSWYFAEGSTASPFDTWILLQNPNANPSIANVTFMKDNGEAISRQFTLPPTSRFSLFANQIVPDAAISTLIQTDQPIFAERSMYFRSDGHGSTGVNQPSHTWYLAEGSTAPPFDTWILAMNPNPAPATVTFTLMAEGGANKTIVRNMAPTSRCSIFANLEMPGVAFSAKVDGTLPIIVERAMYVSGGGGHGSTGVTTPSRNWYLAEGNTLPGFDTWLLLMNPNDT
ncbi:MAG: glycosyl hydrolase family 18 protein, partial [Chloroflexota bacterium]